MIRDPHLRTTLERVAQGSRQPEDLDDKQLSDRSMAAALLNLHLIETHLERIATALTYTAHSEFLMKKQREDDEAHRKEDEELDSLAKTEQPTK